MSIFNNHRGLKKYTKQNPPWHDDLVLHELICFNEVKKLNEKLKLVKFGKININVQDDDFGGRTALHVACHSGRK